MKRNLLFAISMMVAMASCTTQVDDFMAEAPNADVTFQVANYLSQTKAAAAPVDPVLFPSTDTFGMFAFYDAESPGAQHQTFMNNETISYDSTLKKWKASSTYYWPKTGNLDFLGYYPKSTTPWINANATATQLTGNASGLLGTEDYMYADMAVDYQYNPDAVYNTDLEKGVPILFHHALAKVSVQVKAETLFNKETEAASDVKWQITLKQILFEDMYSSGTVTIGQESYTAGTAQQVAWTIPTSEIWTPSGSTAAINGAPEVTSDGLELTTSFQTTLDRFTVLPQSLENKKMYIEYEIVTTTGTGTITEVIKREIELDSEDSTLSGIWGMNKDITYSITVDPETDEIYFDPAIKIWDTPSDPYTTPIYETPASNPDPEPEP